MSGSIQFSVSDIAIETGVFGLFVFAVVFFFLAWRLFSSRMYVSIMAMSITMSVYLAAGIVSKFTAMYYTMSAVSSTAIVIQELCLSLFLPAIPYFWSLFIERPIPVSRFNGMLTVFGIVYAISVVLTAFVMPSTFLFGFVFEGTMVTFRTGVLYTVTLLPISIVLLYSLVLLILDFIFWKNLRAYMLLTVGCFLSVIFAFSSAWKSLTGTYLDPFPAVRFSRVVLSLSLFCFSVSCVFIRRFLGEARQVRLTRDKLDALLVTDDLTGLPNRTALVRDIEKAVACSIRSAVIVLDIDHFNDLNESYGLEFGNELLLSISGTLLTLLPPGSTMYRIGNDDFAALFPLQGNRDEAELCTSVLRDRLRKGIVLNGDRFPLDATFAVVVVPDDGEDPGMLLTMSYSCLRDAKEEPGKVKVFSRTWHEEALERIATVRLLRSDLAAGRFHVEYQPIHDKTGSVSAMEVLLRWDGVGRNHGPSTFVPIAESAGLMKDLGMLVIEILIGELGREISTPGFPYISVNLSPLQLLDFECIIRLVNKVHSLGVPLPRLQWEVTESVLLDRDSMAVRSLKFLHEAGCSIAIDDFGSGYSNLGYLCNLPIDKLKIDRSFFRSVPGSEPAESLAKSLAGIGLSLDLSLLAEGIEHAEQLAFLVNAGYSEFQGYYFSRPLRKEALIWYLSTSTVSGRS